ncbi:peptidase M23B [Thermosinus carboxydivorans Nor1]|uniref:Peptidase M23B n=1 Tax=Thermosinus carboxydivorans Nor1 TaxID=401526 RepID=A1HSM7_9FIRM|nr:M23 family metallopeptidase [Thermosinus carboxydivorans]EAX46997.1 peptidase M23B [Thermosinus carboxydivorans Nor1]
MASIPNWPRQPDRREYTIMIVPHHGQAIKSIRIPIRAVKIAAAILCLFLVAVVGGVINYRHTVNAAQAERAELERLRQVNGAQLAQIEQLAKATAALQEDMNRLNQLDAEIRRLVNTEETGPSRSGVSRPTAGHGGQGGPVVKPQLNEIAAVVHDLQQVAKAREQSLETLRDRLIERNARLAATPSIWPASGEVTSRFGWRSSPWGWGSDWHPGIDIAGDYGMPIVATADGVVTYSGWYGGYGKMVEIDHGNGIVTIYGHNSQNLVETGQRVKKGEIIAYMGSTGISTGPHVHYEVRVNGTAVNPANFL